MTTQAKVFKLLHKMVEYRSPRYKNVYLEVAKQASKL